MNQLAIEHIDFKGLPSYDSYTKRYVYDDHGNIQRVEEYPLGTIDFTNTTPIKVIDYGYNQSWQDQLASYGITEDGVTTTINITYDGQGNPISITHFKYDGIVYDRALLDWDGRQLARISIIDDGLVVTTITYKYNDQGYRISKSITNYSYTLQEVEIYNDGDIQGTDIVPDTANLFDTYEEVTVYISAFGWHTFSDYGDLYIEDYDFLGDLFIEVFPEGIYIYAPYGVWKVIGSVPVVTSSTTTTTHYSLSNGLVIYETDGTYAIYYTYDYDGTLISFNYDNNINDAIEGKEYFYIKNQQGDITALVNSQGIIQVEYRYDAWGNIIYINTPSGSTLDPSINPYTYRGYRYDSETGLYYCNSRYYNPEWGRWLNADSVNYLDPGSTNGLNLYAYCGNNPVMGYDPNGTFFITIGVLLVIAKVVATIVVIAAVAATVHDVYQLESGEVNATPTDSREDEDSFNDNVQIINSRKILTPWIQFGYSFYLNHINENTKNVIRGSSFGVQYEWQLHNVAYYLGIGNKTSAESVDIGKTIFADSHDDIMGYGMKLSYVLYNPVCFICDLITNGG